MTKKARENCPKESFDTGCHLYAAEKYWERVSKNPEPIPTWCDGEKCPLLWEHRCVAVGKDLTYMQRCPEMRTLIRDKAKK